MADPSPLVCLEALIAGMPLAVSVYTGNMPEIVQHNLNGFIFDPVDSKDVQGCLHKMVSLSPSDRTEMANKSKQIADEHFDPDRVLTRFFDELFLI